MALERKVQPKEDDRILYPADDGVPMEDIKHAVNAHWMREVVEERLAAQGRDVFAPVNNFVYFDDGPERRCVGPDFYAILDVLHDPERDCWRAWNEGGRLPDIIIEFESKKSKRKDRVTNFAIYRDKLRVPNYFICNNRRMTLDGFELCQGDYRPLNPNAEGRLWCSVLGLWIGFADGWLRWFDADGTLLPTHEERAQAQTRRAEEEAHRAEEACRRADAEAKRRQEAEHELGRIRAELDRLKFRSE